jgi:hypothetical protein
MRKYFVILLIIIFLLAGCGENGKQDDNKEPFVDEHVSNAETPIAAGLTGVETTLPDISKKEGFIISQGGKTIDPYENFLWSETYSDGGWLAADGMGAAYLLPEIAEELPAVKLDDTLGFHVPENMKLVSFDVFNPSYKRIFHHITEKEFRDLNGNLNNGLYYVAVLVNFTGEYIEAENEYNTYGYEYIFRMTVGNMSPEEDLKWEEAPPLYHNAIVRVDGWKQDYYRLYNPEITIITTFEEMNAFRPKSDYSHQNFDAFRELIKQYGAPIFEYNGAVLIAIHIVDSTGSASYSVESVNISDDAIDIGIERMCPEAFTDDEAQWLVFIELDESKYSGQGVDVKLTGI